MSEGQDSTNRPNDWSLFKRLAHYLLQHRGLLAVAAVLYPLDAISVAIPPLLVQRILDEALPARDQRLLLTFAALYLVALVFEYTAGFAAQLAMTVLGQKATARLREDLFARAIRLPSSYFDRVPVGRTLTRVTNDVESLSDVFATGAISVVADVLTIGAVVTSMFILDARLTLVGFTVVPPLVVLAIFFQRAARRAFRAIRAHLASINAFLAEHLAAMAVVQVFRQERRTAEEFESLNEQYRKANRSAILYDAWLFSVVEGIGTLAVAAIVYAASERLVIGALGAGTVVAFIQLINRFFVPIRDLSTKYTVIQSALAGAERVVSLLDEPLGATAAVSPPRPIKFQHEIRFERVWFAYRSSHGEPHWVLRDLSFTVRRGEHVALVGATGSGKSSVLRLLTRQYEVNRGRMTIDGVDLREFDVQALRRFLVPVSQDVFLFRDSIRHNVTLYEPERSADLLGAAQTTGAAAFVERLPDRYDAVLQERGGNLSAGERQLLSFTRALAARPEVLLLDEATSSVDAATEAQVDAALRAATAGRTAIIVAHRQSTIRRADRILVLDQGTIIEAGTHEELCARGGHYATLLGHDRLGREAG